MTYINITNTRINVSLIVLFLLFKIDLFNHQFFFISSFFRTSGTFISYNFNLYLMNVIMNRSYTNGTLRYYRLNSSIPRF